MPVLVLAEHDLGHLARHRPHRRCCRRSSARRSAGRGAWRLRRRRRGVQARRRVAHVLVADHEKLTGLLAEALAMVLRPLSERYSHIVAAAAATGRNIIPHLAASLDLMPVTDVIAIHGPTRFDRPIYRAMPSRRYHPGRPNTS